MIMTKYVNRHKITKLDTLTTAAITKRTSNQRGDKISKLSIGPPRIGGDFFKQYSVRTTITMMKCPCINP